QKIAVRDFVRIEADPHDFHVSGIPVADLAVGRLIDVPAHVSGDSLLHSAQAVEDGFDTPETPATEICRLFIGHNDSMSYVIDKLQRCSPPGHIQRPTLSAINSRTSAKFPQHLRGDACPALNLRSTGANFFSAQPYLQPGIGLFALSPQVVW